MLRYPKGTRDHGITYRGSQETGGAPRKYEQDRNVPWGYCDANYAEDFRDRKSTSGYAFMLANGPISWKLKKQTSVSLSMTEAEYYAIGAACQEAAWLQQICYELFIPLDTTIPILTDNTGAVSLSDNPVFHSRSKHIDIKWHFVRDLIKKKIIRTSHIPGICNGAHPDKSAESFQTREMHGTPRFGVEDLA